MCGGVMYQFNGNEIKTYFPNPHSQLPVINKQGKTILLPWGRRERQVGRLPFGGWARLESIKAGRWHKYFPKAVKLPIECFMEKDYQGKSHWFDLTPGQYIQGLVATYEKEQRIYVVTITPERLDSVIHDRWPRVVW
jgi:hypothetical protein